MNCPYCKRSMLDGNIIGDGRMNIDWVEDTALSDTAKRITLNKKKKFAFKNTMAKGWYCETCKIVIINC